MKRDPGSNYSIVGDDVSSTDTTAASTVVDHSNAVSASFLIICKSVGTSLNAKAQYSADNSTWVDYPASDPALNDDAITEIVAAGNAQLNLPTPRARYSRVLTTSVGAVVATCTSVAGPKRHIAAP